MKTKRLVVWLGFVILGLAMGCDAPSDVRSTATELGTKIQKKESSIEGPLDSSKNQIATSPENNSSETALPSLANQSSSPASSQLARPTTASTKPSTPSLFQRNRQYTLGQLHKNNTTLLLVHEGDIRADYLLKKYLPFIDENQIKEAKKMIWSYDKQFVRLRRNRASILEHATDDQDVDQMLFENKLDIADLVSEIRESIYRDVMSPEQLRIARESFRAENDLQKKTLER